MTDALASNEAPDVLNSTAVKAESPSSEGGMTMKHRMLLAGAIFVLFFGLPILGILVMRLNV